MLASMEAIWGLHGSLNCLGWRTRTMYKGKPQGQRASALEGGCEDGSSEKGKREKGPQSHPARLRISSQGL
jgi:hypothetical protein